MPARKLPRDVMVYMSSFLTLKEYYKWQQTHKIAKCNYIESKIRFHYAKNMFRNRRYILKWCAVPDCVKQVCSCIDITHCRTKVLSVYCSHHAVKYRLLNNISELL